MTVKYRPVNSVIMVREVTLVLALLFICTGAHPSAAPCPTQQACPNITTCAPYVPVTSPLATLPAPPAPPVLGLLKVKGDSSTCRGMVYLGLNGSYGLPLCSDSAQRVPRGTLCRQLGCGGYHQQSETQRHIEGYYIHGNGSLETSTCRALEIHCKAPGDSRELKVYKVVTWLLLGLFLFFLLVRIAPHMYSFICKRYRSSTWIGPAQSQSVSFYRVQAGVPPNNSTSKRTSYPALERLAVNASQETSSNRHSDCDSYN
ncbi:hypothetical protein COCON_G00119870 [Conger conger]|uniref:SRCR domain-containing protein n=1 Tax=Conger conger TaxID=82655 RepID=A0A9Q1HY05_CONCO|nr:uncharacterized protein LOC133135783 isoform X2 [Conger conger]KAJ8269380.1 hypothetical protein COCON_G00119870 [Conger conger]